MRILIGIGNSGRNDDGLGWVFLDRIKQEAGFSADIEYRYQLQVEDAELISRAKHVIFVDSYHGVLPGGFKFEPCKVAPDSVFTSHVLPPGAILHLCRELYGKKPGADLMLIQGSSWELHSGLSPEAEIRLGRALEFFRKKLPF
ncbi:MAG: hydrogenase maturation protease [Xanthomonadales bacterium]|nr:hydrogenase maturation protease [Gammaproteobacteria bacterium]NND57643.1 hydrogenase maturation protease [Xanthomonadales bacterium]